MYRKTASLSLFSKWDNGEMLGEKTAVDGKVDGKVIFYDWNSVWMAPQLIFYTFFNTKIKTFFVQPGKSQDCHMAAEWQTK